MIKSIFLNGFIFGLLVLPAAVAPVVSDGKPMFNWQQMQRWRPSQPAEQRDPLPRADLVVNIAGRAWQSASRSWFRPG